MRALGIKTSELSAVGDAEHPSTFSQFACNPDVVLRAAAMRLFTLLASALGVERLVWSTGHTDRHKAIHVLHKACRAVAV
jgi:hypothetical protein